MPSTKTSSTVVLPNAGGGEAGKRAAGDSAEHAFAQAVQAQDLGLSNATPQSVAAASSAGSASSASRSDHAHAHGNQAGGALHATAVANTSAGFISASDQNKLNGIATTAAAVATTGTPANVAQTAALGVSTTAARSDHAHAHGTQTDGTMHAAATNAAPGFAVLSTTTPVSVGTAAVGTGTTVARADHAHAHGNQAGGTLHANAANGTPGFAVLATASPQDVAAAASVGASTNVAREDHAHFHGNQAGGSLHALASGSAAGFMQPSDFSKLAGVEAGAQVTSTARVLTALAAANTNITINAQRLSSVADPTVTSDAATKNYVDTSISTASVSTLAAANTATTASIAAQHATDIKTQLVREVIQSHYTQSLAWTSTVNTTSPVEAPKNAFCAINDIFYVGLNRTGSSRILFTNDLTNWGNFHDFGSGSGDIVTTPIVYFSQVFVLNNVGQSWVGAELNDITYGSGTWTPKASISVGGDTLGPPVKHVNTDTIITYSVTGRTVYRTGDGGTTWTTPANSGFPSTGGSVTIISGMAKRSGSDVPLYLAIPTGAGSFDNQVYTTNSAVTTWIPFTLVEAVSLSQIAYTGIDGMRFIISGKISGATSAYAAWYSDDAINWTRLCTTVGLAGSPLIVTPAGVILTDLGNTYLVRDPLTIMKMPIPPKVIYSSLVAGTYCATSTIGTLLYQGNGLPRTIYAGRPIVSLTLS